MGSVNQINVETLRSWLEEKRAITVLDVRDAAARGEWSIPGSIHVDAMPALKTGDPGPLASFAPPGPVVAVCHRGMSSLKVADYLASRGVEVYSLAGGMQAWSLAWNVAEWKIGPAKVIQVRRTGKGCLSYLLVAGGEGVVIDASVDAGVYQDLAERAGAKVRWVVETHIHADHITRGRTLAEMTGATYVLPAQQRAVFPFHAVSDGDEIPFGGSRLKVMRTPGHTMESTCYLLDGKALCSGDTIFLAGVGRPDLEAKGDEARMRAGHLHRSLRRLLELPPATLILPTHVSAPVPFDGEPLVARLGDVAAKLGEHFATESAFVEHILGRIPPAPPNSAHIVQLNERGEFPADPAELEAGANRCAVV